MSRAAVADSRLLGTAHTTEPLTVANFSSIVYCIVSLPLHNEKPRCDDLFWKPGVNWTSGVNLCQACRPAAATAPCMYMYGAEM